MSARAETGYRARRSTRDPPSGGWRTESYSKEAEDVQRQQSRCLLHSPRLELASKVQRLEGQAGRERGQVKSQKILLAAPAADIWPREDQCASSAHFP